MIEIFAVGKQDNTLEIEEECFHALNVLIFYCHLFNTKKYKVKVCKNEKNALRKRLLID